MLSYAEHNLVTHVDYNTRETWRVFKRDFEGLRVSHGPYEEWPVVVPVLGFRWNAYEFNGHKSMPNPNSPGAIPEVITRIVKNLIHG